MESCHFLLLILQRHRQLILDTHQLFNRDLGLVGLELLLTDLLLQRLVDPLNELAFLAHG